MKNIEFAIKGYINTVMWQCFLSPCPVPWANFLKYIQNLASFVALTSALQQHVVTMMQ